MIPADPIRSFEDICNQGSTPALGDLYERITPRYAADWKVIGTLLGIPNEELKAIEGGNPTNLKWCCNKMLEKWLEVDTTASWEKLSVAIHSPAVSGTHENNKAICSNLSLGDLYERITPRYAAYWKVIGTLLGLPSEDLKIIEAGYPTDLKWCCNKMLEKWLEVDTTASWEKLSAAIQSPAVSSAYRNAPDGYQSSFRLCEHRATDSNSPDNNEQLKSIRCYHGFYEEGSMCKCRAVEQLPCFKDATISLHGSMLLGKDVDYVAVFIISSTNKHWIEVNLSNCGINDHYIHLLYQRLHEHNDVTIRVLQLSKNYITGLYSCWISDITVDYKIQKLFVNGNYGIGQSEQFYCMLTNPNTNLRILHMENVQLSDTDAYYLFTALQDNSTLRELNVTDNGITDHSCAVIATTLQKNNCLSKLWMWKNPIGGEASKLILEDLKHNNSLEQLGLCYYSESIENSIAILQEGVNKTREGRKCLVKLEIHFMYY